MYKKIMVPLDSSELAERVLPHVENLAKKEQAEVNLIIVVEEFEMPIHGGVVTDEDELKQIQHKQEMAAEDYINRLANSFKAKGINTRSKVAIGKIADSLIDYADDNFIDLIVMATHGRSGISRWIWGSIAEKILHSSTVPILLIHVPSAK